MNKRLTKAVRKRGITSRLAKMKKRFDGKGRGLNLRDENIEFSAVFDRGKINLPQNFYRLETYCS